MKKVYLVGGAVRDELMGIEPQDHDYVVVGSTPEEMLAEGYKQVGADFPVFLHPETGDEYALARTERKSGEGHKGFICEFSPDVTLMQDLRRRDLTINAMAKDMETGEIIDYFRGQADLKDGLLREVSEHFYEDPLRVLRVGRFLARYPKFNVTPALDLMCDNVDLSHLTPERIWQEMRKALGSEKPSRFFEFMFGRGVFHEIDALWEAEQTPEWHPEGDAFVHTMLALDKAAEGGASIWVKFGVLCHDLGKPVVYNKYGKLHGHEDAGVPVVKKMCEQLKIPNEYKRVGVISAKYHTHIHRAREMKASTLRDLIAVLKDEDLFNLIAVAKWDKAGRGEPLGSEPYPEPKYVMMCWRAMKGVDRKEFTHTMPPGPKVGQAIRMAEIRAIKAKRHDIR